MKRLRIPSDVDREDQLLAGLSARQLAVIASGSLACWVLYAALHAVVHPIVLAVLCTPILIATVALTGARVDGLQGTDVAVAVARHVTSPRRRALGLSPEPSGRHTARGVAALALGITAVSEDGVLSCATEDVMVCAASSSSFPLRTDGEQEALAEAFGRYLNGLGRPIQIVIHTDRADLSDMVGRLRASASAAPHSALRQAVSEHADFLQSLGGRGDIMRRRVLLVLRTAANGDVRALACAAVEALAPAGIRLQPLTGHEAVAVVTRAADRVTETDTAALALPGAVIHRGGCG